MDREASSEHDVLSRKLLDECTEPTRIPFSFLDEVTNGFSDDLEIGRGRFAVVYKVCYYSKLSSFSKRYNVETCKQKHVLNNKQTYRKITSQLQGKLGHCTIAVKRVSNMHMNEETFLKYVECLVKLKHKNVVRFLGYCAESDERFLCFEYLSKGSLDVYITGKIVWHVQSSFWIFITSSI
jgi:serine/threonine protein kinase